MDMQTGILRQHTTNKFRRELTVAQEYTEEYMITISLALKTLVEVCVLFGSWSTVFSLICVQKSEEEGREANSHASQTHTRPELIYKFQFIAQKAIQNFVLPPLSTNRFPVLKRTKKRRNLLRPVLGKQYDQFFSISSRKQRAECRIYDLKYNNSKVAQIVGHNSATVNAIIQSKRWEHDNLEPNWVHVSQEVRDEFMPPHLQRHKYQERENERS
jgi:hypothetical protein